LAAIHVFAQLTIIDRQTQLTNRKIKLYDLREFCSINRDIVYYK